MTTRPYNNKFASLNTAAIQSGTSFVRSDYDTALASNIVYTYAHARHNVLGVAYQGRYDKSISSTECMLKCYPPGSMDPWASDLVEIQLGGRLETPCTFRVWVYASTSSEASADAVLLTASVEAGGIVLGESSESIADTDAAWYYVDIEIGELGSAMPYDVLGERVRLHVRATVDHEVVQAINLYSICAYQIRDTSSRTHLDLTTSELGQTDCPRSACLATLERNEVQAVHSNRVPRANVFSHWYRRPYATFPSNGTYQADDGGLGRYKLVKRAGCSAMYVYACVNNISLGTWDLKSTITSTTQVTATVTSITTQTGPSYWVGSKFTFSTANTATEKELELRMCGKSTVTVAQATGLLYGVCVTEAPISATSISHTVPDCRTYLVGSYAAAGQQLDELNTLRHLWARQPAIALSDWRNGTTDNINRVTCDTTSANKADPIGGAMQSSSVVARALAYPSYGCSRYRITLGFEMHKDGSTWDEVMQDASRLKVMFQLSNSTAEDTYTWVGPMAYLGTDGDYTGSWGEMGSTGVGSWLVREGGRIVDPGPYNNNNWHYGYFRATCETSVVSAAQWLSPTSTITAASLAQPLQLWVMSWTDTSTNYIYPRYLTIEEVPLAQDDFP